MEAHSFAKQLTLLDISSVKETTLPEKIGPYLIEALIAKSHYSLLYLGYHPENRQVVALKILAPDVVQKKEMTTSFMNEGRIIQMASHPNIVELYAQGEWEGGLYLAMEFIRGVSLRQFIQQHSLSIKRCLDIVLQVSYALCHLHAHGIIHGDLKPENILITEEGEVKVVDFGIAQLHDRHLPTLCHAGTPSYMSPEHKASIKELTFSSDIYALGVIAYELITGKLCFGAIHLENIPTYIRPLIEKCLKKSLKERYSDVVDLIHDLSVLFNSGLITESPLTPTRNDETLFDTLKKLFPLPEVSMEALDFGFSRKFFKAEHISPLWATPVNNGGILFGSIQGTKTPLENALIESMALGFIKVYLQNSSSFFVFTDFLQKLNILCHNSRIQLNFSWVYMDAYLDELHLCYGGFLAPILIKNQKISLAPIGLTNPPLGATLDPLSLGTESFEIGSQCLIHPLTHPEDLAALEKLYLSCSLYSAQNISDTLIKKSTHSDLSNLICCLKVM